ncbi:MAG TPA: ribokinase [Caulobacteraceae bacterium]|nr:ribokinase [Caulobacteraceae bacterium]
MSVAVLGSINLDLVASVAELPRPGETVMATSYARFAGGKGANQARASAAWGAPTRMIGAVGVDEAGEFLLGGLADARVDTAGVARLADETTGQALIFVSAAGENMIVVVGGANQAIGPAAVNVAPLHDCRVFLSQLETPVAAVAALFESETARGGVRILNAAPALAQARALFPLTDILVVNETELERYAGAASSVEAAARRLMTRAGQTVIVTLGAAGAVAIDADDRVAVAGRPAAVLDTTGAGDCFCGVLAAALELGVDLKAALSSANMAASLSTETAGAAAPADLRARCGALGLS